MLVLFAACVGHEEPVPPDETGGADTGSEDTADTRDSGRDSGPIDTGPVDYTAWDGSRTFSYDLYGYTCDETVPESGTEVPEGADRDTLQGLCADCTAFYVVDPEQAAACDWLTLETTWRGMKLGDGTAEVHLYHPGSAGIEEFATDTAATFDGATVRYAYPYEADWITVDVTGVARFRHLD